MAGSLEAGAAEREGREECKGGVGAGAISQVLKNICRYFCRQVNTTSQANIVRVSGAEWREAEGGGGVEGAASVCVALKKK